MDVVCIRYDDLVAACSKDESNVNRLIEQAFSTTGLGLLAITEIPHHLLTNQRLQLLRLSQQLATLPPSQLEEITDHMSSYQVGWSHGREKLEGNKADYSKGSFYANPLTENLVETMLERRCLPAAGAEDSDLLEWDKSLSIISTDMELQSLAITNPAFFAPNIWPTQFLPTLQSTFCEVGQFIHTIGMLVAKCCDMYVSTVCPTYIPVLERTVRHSKCCKGRLLHYFPSSSSSTTVEQADDVTPGTMKAEEEDDDTRFSNWCGWHNDHGSLTGLLPALYLDVNGNIVDPAPDPKAGLYIKARNGQLVHAKLPPNSIAYQIGETAQIHTGGILKATPHAVRGCSNSNNNISRETFAVFMEPEYHSTMSLPDGRTLADTQCVEDEKYLPQSVKTLRSRWKLGMTFGEFSNATFAAFH
jgi:isopenicillin N synthase-like dioxygenase